MPLTPSVPVPPGEPRAPDQVLAMQSEPTSSTLQLVANDMTGIMETLDTRELDLEDGEYDAADSNAAGASPSGCRGAHLPLPHVLLFPDLLVFLFPQPSICPSRQSTKRWASRSPPPKSSCPRPSPPRSWRWSASPRHRTASTRPRRGASARCSQTLALPKKSAPSVGCVGSFADHISVSLSDSKIGPAFKWLPG